MTALTRPARALRALAAALAAGAFLALASAQPALAHDELLGSSPEPGQVFETGPEAVELTFSNDVIETGTVVEVVDHHGDEVAIGETEVLGPEVTATLPTELSGEYQVRWRVVSSDGHPIEGTIDFGVGAGATGVWASEAPHDSGDADESVDVGDSGDASDSAADADAPNGWAIAGFVFAALAVLALVVILIVRTMQRRPPTA